MNIDRALAILGIVLGVIVSWYFYDKSIAVKHINYKTEIFPDIIANPSSTEPNQFRVINSTGDAIDAPVYSGRHTIWNDGNAAIVPSDVLEPLAISFDGSGSVLIAANISRQSRQDIACKTIKKTGTLLEIHFKLLEPGDGCEFQVIYSGNRYPKFKTNATIVGVSNISVHSTSFEDVVKKSWTDKLISILPTAFLLLTTAGFCLVYTLTKSPSKSKTLYAVFVTTALCGEIAFLLSQYSEYHTYSKYGPSIPGYSTWKPAAGISSSGKPETTNQGNYGWADIAISNAPKPSLGERKATPSAP